MQSYAPRTAISRPRRRLKAGLGLVAAMLLSACEMPAELFPTEGPTLVAATEQNLSLRALPPPRERVTVAVYGFPDLTGQYKERDNVQSLSTAVSQGGTAYLMKAVQDAGERRWFAPLDRAGLQDVLRERQIITEMRRQYRGEEQIDPAALGPLRHAGIILRGAIIGYDSNMQTGGFGARYLGIGGDTQWRMDTVTVSLSAVATETGEALVTVTAQKSIASSAIRGSVFRYVALDELLELEGGVTANEPRSIALQQSIEKAVYALIVEGAELDIWSFADHNVQAQLISAHRAEKFSGVGPETVRRPLRPFTRNATRVVQTRPAPRPAPAVVREVPAAPAAAAPPAPPPPGDDPEPLG